MPVSGRPPPSQGFCDMLQSGLDCSSGWMSWRSWLTKWRARTSTWALLLRLVTQGASCRHCGCQVRLPCDVGHDATYSHLVPACQGLSSSLASTIALNTRPMPAAWLYDACSCRPSCSRSSSCRRRPTPRLSSLATSPLMCAGAQLFWPGFCQLASCQAWYLVFAS